MNSLRVLFFNIHGGFDRHGHRDLSRIHSLLEEYHIDIAILQEMETRPSRGGAAQDLDRVAGVARPHRFYGATITEGEAWYGNLIVSRYPLRHQQAYHLGTDAALEPRNAIDAVVATPLGDIRFVGTHLSLSNRQRRQEIQALARLVENVEETRRLPIFLGGDFNEWRMASGLFNYLDLHLRPLRNFRTFPSWLPVFKLDRIWHDSQGFEINLRPLAARPVRTLSDHLPLLLELSNR